jgi:hypothetical protein
MCADEHMVVKNCFSSKYQMHHCTQIKEIQNVEQNEQYPPCYISILLSTIKKPTRGRICQDPSSCIVTPSTRIYQQSSIVGSWLSLHSMDSDLWYALKFLHTLSFQKFITCLRCCVTLSFTTFSTTALKPTKMPSCFCSQDK